MRYMKTKITKFRLSAGLVLFLLFAQALVPALVSRASATSLNHVMVRTDTMTASAATTGTVCAAASSAGAGTEADVKVTFPTGYTVSTTTGNWTTDTSTTTGWPSGATAWPGMGTATAASGQDVTFPSNNITDTTVHCFNWTNSAALSNKSSATNDNAGTVTTEASGPTTIDSGSYAIATVTSSDVTVTATVNPSFQMSFAGGSTDALGTLTTGSVASSSTVTMTVNTNAQYGWQAWVKDSNTGLHSTTASYTISSTAHPGLGSASTALVAGTEGYNVGVAYSQTSGTCNAGSAVSTNFDKAGGSNKGGSFDGTLRTILTCGGTTNAGVITPTNFAAINGATAAATDYTDTQTYVAAGLF